MGRCAIFTLEKNEKFHLPQWVKYYSQHFAPEDMYILDHQSTDPEVTAYLDNIRKLGYNVREVGHHEIFNHDWLLGTVHTMQSELLDRYEYVIYTDVDEFLVPATDTLKEFIERAGGQAYRATGYDILEDKMYRHGMFDKTLMTNRPLQWAYGYHTASPEYPVSADLYLYHLHKLDFAEAWAKNMRWKDGNWNKEAVRHGHSIQNQLTDIEEFKKWFYDTKGQPLEELDDRAKELCAYLIGN